MNIGGLKMFKKFILTTLLLLTVLSVGCSSSSIPAEQPKVSVTEAELNQCYKFADSIFKQKETILANIQLGSAGAIVTTDKLKECGNASEVLLADGYTELSQVFDMLHLAGLEFDLYSGEKKADNYTKGTNYLNEAERIYKTIKR